MTHPVIRCNFSSTPPDPSLTETLQRIDGKKQALDRHRPLTGEQTANLKKLYDVDLTYHSNAIEGSTLSYAETKLILEEGITIAGKKLAEHLEVINHKEAIDFVEELATRSDAPLTERDLLAIHNLILRGIDSREAGRYRRVLVGVRQGDGAIRHFCDPLQVPDQMGRFFRWLGEPAAHPILRACDAHFHLVTIHPFADGNGRTARLVMNLLLIAQGYPPAVIRMEQRPAYIEALETAQGKGDLNPFHRVICTALEDSLDLYLETLATGIRYL